VSAICGVINLDSRPAAQAVIAAMSAALAHRGPNGEALWLGASEALAHRLLHTTPESLTEVQPVVRGDADLVLVADARIDNRAELIGLLRPRATSLSDSELILEAYARWGSDCVDRLIGDFAFALWDGRLRTLFCARDPMGVKPLYYFRNERVFAFASELKSLFTLPEVKPTIDPEQVALFVGWHHEERERTMYRDLMRLPAAHTLLVSRDRTVLRQYWTPESSPEVRFARDEEYVEGFREVFATAVKARLRSAHPVGATLSGGLDSTSIVCMSRKLGGNGSAPLHTFSLIFPELPEKELRLIDERQYVDAALRIGGLEPHFVRGDKLSPMRDARRILWHLDEPYSTPNLYLHWGLFEAANTSGVRVLLDGFDGDSAVSHGFGRLTSLARERRWEVLEAEVRAFSAHHGMAPDRVLHRFVLPRLAELAQHGRVASWLLMAVQLARRFGVPRREMAARYGLRPLLALLGMNDAEHASRGRALDGAMLKPSLAHALSRHRTTAERGESRWSTGTEREAHIKGLSQPMYQLTLEIADKASAAFGIESRYPFFDRRLIAFCIGLPESVKFNEGWPRLLFRRAMQGILPPEVQWRSSKANLSPNFQRRFRGVDMAPVVQPPRNEVSRYLNDDRVSELQHRYRAEPDDSHVKETATLLFRVAVLSLWLEDVSGCSDHMRPEAALSPAAA
jgi:asparagine synthase (glutamine-hydrolysing)